MKVAITRFAVWLIVFMTGCLITANAAPVLKNLETRFWLTNFSFIESDFDLENAKELLGLPLSSSLFKPYDGKTLPKNTNYSRSMYTFQMEFFIDEAMTGGTICLYVGNIDWPTFVYLNGSLIHIKGSISSNYYHSMNYGFDRIILPVGILKFGADATNIIQVQGFPKFEIYPLPEMFLTSYEDATVSVFIRNLFTIHMVQGAVVVGMIMFFYFMLLFISMRNKNWKYLYMALICIFYVMGQINITLSQDFSNEVLLEKISRTGLPLSSVALAMFLLEFTDTWKKKFLLRALIFSPLILISLVTLFFDSKQAISEYFNIVTNLVVTPMLIFTLTISTIAVIKKPEKRKEILVIMFTILVLVSASIHDLVNLWNSKTPFAWLNPYGYVLLVFTLFFIQAREQAKLYQESIDHMHQIDIKNASLNKLIENLRMVSNNLSGTSGRLQKTIESSLDLIHWYESSTEQIAEIMNNKFVDIKSLIDGITEMIKTSGDRVPKAIGNQTALIGQVKSTISENDESSRGVSKKIADTNETAQHLAEMAARSVIVLSDTKKAMHKITEFSTFVLSLLKTMEEITDRSSTLAINASIEAVKAGKAGQGFAVVAKEMRNLSRETKTNLESSMKKIKELAVVVSRSMEMSDQVSTSIQQIIESSRASAEMISDVNRMIQKQRDDFTGITSAAENLFNDALTIKQLSENEVAENNRIVETMQEFGDSFNSIIDMLGNQKNMQVELQNSMSSIRGVMEENMKLVEVLNDNITRSGEGITGIREVKE